MNRMISEFLELAAYSVPSKHEAEIRQCLMEKLLELGFSVSVDDAFQDAAPKVVTIGDCFYPEGIRNCNNTAYAAIMQL